jgi:hypothetical protein
MLVDLSIATVMHQMHGNDKVFAEPGASRLLVFCKKFDEHSMIRDN